MVSNAIKAVLALKGIKRAELASRLDIGAQSVANKFQRDSWSSKDLLQVAQISGGKLAFIMSDGQIVYISDEDTNTAE